MRTRQYVWEGLAGGFSRPHKPRWRKPPSEAQEHCELNRLLNELFDEFFEDLPEDLTNVDFEPRTSLGSGVVKHDASVAPLG